MNNLNRRDIYLKVNEKLKIGMEEFLFLFAFFIYLINKSLSTTMFNVYMSNKVTFIIELFLICIVFIKVLFFDKYYIKEIVAIILLVSTAMVCFLLTGQKEIIIIVTLIIGSKDVSFRKIIKVYFYVTLSVTLIAMVAAQMGIIEHIVTERKGVLRYAFGSIYCTNFAAHIFYLIISYLYINYNKITIFKSLIFGLLGVFVYKFCDARLDFISIMMVTIFSLYISFKRNKEIIKLNIVKRSILIFSVPICAIVSIIITLKYNPLDPKMVALDKLLSNRLNQGMKGITDYGIKLFGQVMEMKGNGGTSESVINDYFFIDSSYLSIALKYGIVLLILLCVYFVIYNKKRIEMGDIKLPIFILFISINSLVAHHFIDIAYNPFILVFFTIYQKEIRFNKYYIYNLQNK